MLRETLGTVEIDPAITGPLRADVKPKAPGMKYRHYAPKAELMLVESSDEVDGQKRVAEKIMELAKEKLEAGYQVGIICTDESREYYTEGIVRSLGLREMCIRDRSRGDSPGCHDGKLSERSLRAQDGGSGVERAERF